MFFFFFFSNIDSISYKDTPQAFESAIHERTSEDCVELRSKKMDRISCAKEMIDCEKKCAR